MNDPFEYIHNNKILFEELSKKTHCEGCDKILYKKELVASNMQDSKLKKQKFHLDCFYPLFKTPIDDSMYFIIVGEKSSLIKAKKWVSNWNSLLQKRDSFSNPSLFQMSLSIPEEKMTKINLNLSEIVKILSYLTSEEIFYRIKFVSKYFYWVCWQDTLWREFSHRDFHKEIINSFQIRQVIKSQIPWANVYLSLRGIACYNCKSNKGEDLKVCPIEKKPLCLRCRSNEPFTLLTIPDIKRKYNHVLSEIFCEVVEKKAFRYDGETVYYKKDVDLALVAYNLYKNHKSTP